MRDVHPTQTARGDTGCAAAAGNRSNAKQQHNVLIVKQPNEHDVVLGRGVKNYGFPGNRKYLQMVKARKLGYCQGTRSEKVEVIKSIVAQVKELGGRFLKQDDGADYWVEVSDKKARAKVSQALREGAPELRLICAYDALTGKGVPVHHHDASQLWNKVVEYGGPHKFLPGTAPQEATAVRPVPATPTAATHPQKAIEPRAVYHHLPSEEPMYAYASGYSHALHRGVTLDPGGNTKESYQESHHQQVEAAANQVAIVAGKGSIHEHPAGQIDEEPSTTEGTKPVAFVANPFALEEDVSFDEEAAEEEDIEAEPLKCEEEAMVSVPVIVETNRSSSRYQEHQHHHYRS